jgi:hypothetical protein
MPEIGYSETSLGLGASETKDAIARKGQKVSKHYEEELTGFPCSKH